MRIERLLKITYVHARSERIEDTGNADFYSFLTLIRVGEGFCYALSFVIASANPDGIDIAPATKVLESKLSSRRGYSLVFMLRMHLRVTINLFFVSVSEQWQRARTAPDVLVSKNRALVRFARPSMFIVPMKDVFTVLTGLN